MDNQFDFMHLKMRIGGVMVVRNLDEDLRIPDDVNELQDSIRQYPNQYTYWAHMLEVARGEESQVKRQFEYWESDLYVELRRRMQSEGTERVTEASVRARLLSEYREEYEAWNKKLDDAQYRKNATTVAMRSMLEKGTAMINLLSYKKQQMMDAGRSQ